MIKLQNLESLSGSKKNGALLIDRKSNSDVWITASYISEDGSEECVSVLVNAFDIIRAISTAAIASTEEPDGEPDDYEPDDYDEIDYPEPDVYCCQHGENKYGCEVCN